MTKQNFFEDVSKMATSAVDIAMNVRREIENMTKPYIEQTLKKMNLVTREEFEVVQSMVVKSRQEQEKLKSELEDLKKKFESKPKAKTKK